MDEGWYDDVFCATCKYGYLVEDIDGFKKAHCYKKNREVSTDDVCVDHEYKKNKNLRR